MVKDFEQHVVEALAKLQQGQNSLQKNYNDLRQDTRRLEVLYEDMDDKIDTIIEVIALTIEKVSDHELRLKRLESAT